MARRVGIGVLAWLLVMAGVRASFALPERCRVPPAEQVRGAMSEAVGWFERNLRPDGRWVYGYERDVDEIDHDYNVVRHGGVLLSLAHANAADVSGAAEVFAGGLEFVLDNLVPIRDGAAQAFAVGGPLVEAGASALTLAALVEARRATGDPTHDELMRDLGEFLVGQVADDGQVLAYWSIPAEAVVPEATSPFYTGETLFALAALHATFPLDGWDEPARRIGRYVAVERDDREPRFPPVSDHWAAYAYDEIAHWPERSGLSPHDADYAARLAGLFSVQARWESQKSGLLGDLTHGPDVLGAGVGTWGEGLGALWRAGEGDPRLASDRDAIGRRALCVAALLVERQVGAARADASNRPDLERGAWFVGGRTQMDDQQHALSALSAAEQILYAEPS